MLDAMDEQLILSFFATKNPRTGGSFASWVQFLIGTLDNEVIMQTEPLYYAASYDMVSILKILLNPKLGVKLDQRGGRFQSTPLFVACWRGNTNAAKLLVEAGADPYARDSSCYTCRGMAERKDMKEVIDLMEKRRKRRH